MDGWLAIDGVVTVRNNDKEQMSKSYKELCGEGAIRSRRLVPDDAGKSCKDAGSK